MVRYSAPHEHLCYLLVHLLGVVPGITAAEEISVAMEMGFYYIIKILETEPVLNSLAAITCDSTSKKTGLMQILVVQPVYELVY